MSSIQSLAPSPVADTHDAAAAVALDAEFEARWVAWVTRGHAHERLVRRKLVVLAGVLATGAAIVYAFMS